MRTEDAEYLIGRLNEYVAQFETAADPREVRVCFARLDEFLSRNRNILVEARLTIVADTQRALEHKMRETLAVIAVHGITFDPTVLGRRTDVPLSPAPTLWDRILADDAMDRA